MNPSENQNDPHDPSANDYRDKFGDDSKPTQDTKKPGSKDARSPGTDLAKEEKAAANPDNPMNYGPSAHDDMRDGLGIKPGSRQGFASRLYKGSAFKKRVAIAGVAAGGSAAVAGLLFFALLPLKIEHMVSNLRDEFSAPSNDALEKQTGKLFNNYMIKKVFPILGKGTCRTTIDAGCIALDSDSNTPVGKLFQGWKQGRIEQKLAQNYNLAFGRDGGGYYMNTRGGRINLGGSGTSIFGDSGTSTATRAQIRTAVNDALKEGTKWDKIYFRYAVGGLLSQKYGVKRCIVFCDTRDKFNDGVDSFRFAAKAKIIERVISPVSEGYGLIMSCLISNAAFCSTALEDSEPGETERRTPFQNELTGKLEAYAAKYGVAKLSDLVADANTLSNQGFTRLMARKLATALASKTGGDVAGAAAGQLAEKAVTPIGWTFFLARMVSLGESIGPLLRYHGYATKAAGAVAMYSTMATVSAEMKSSNTNAVQLGSFADALSTNLSGSAEDQVDATQSPVYDEFMGTGVPENPLTAFLPTASAAPASEGGVGDYTCNNGQYPPAGEKVCPEENLAQGNATADEVSNFAGSLGPIKIVAKFVSKLDELVGAVFQAAFNLLCVGPCNDLVGAIGEKLSGVFSWTMDKAISSNFSKNLSGARIFNIMAAGSAVLHSDACMQLLGCAVVNGVTVDKIRDEQRAARLAEFNQKPFLDKIFDTSTPYSTASKLALSMPSGSAALSTSVSSFLTNPLAGFSGIFSALMAPPALAANNPGYEYFGVPQNAYTDSQIPEDPEKYWTDNCMGNYQDQWVAAQVQDPNTGQAMATRTEPCMLINSATQMSGGLFDASLLPNDGSGGNGGGETTPPPSSGDGDLGWPVSLDQWPDRSQPVAECGLLYSDGTIHTGIDISVPTGTNIYAAADGEVVYRGGSYGMLTIKTNIIDHITGGPLYVNYQHLSSITPADGASVKRGDLVARSGSVGAGSPHLHFSLWTEAGPLSGHVDPDSHAGQILGPKLRNPINYLDLSDGRNIAECEAP